MKFIFDTETTGLVAWHLLANDPCQPRLVQLGGVLVDPAWNEVSVISVMVKPENFLIPAEASRIHGITTERAHKLGLPLKTVLSLFFNLCRVAEEVWAFNAQYDETVMVGELGRIGVPWEETRVVRCAMLGCKNILAIPQPPNDRRIYPGRKDGDFKYPSLKEAHQFFFNEGFDRAHDALADVRATARVMKATANWNADHQPTQPMRPEYKGD